MTAKTTSVSHFNRVLKQSEKRAWELEQKLIDLLQPILERAGNQAADEFERMATDHLTAALVETDVWLLASTKNPRAVVRSLALTAATTPDLTQHSTMVALKPRREEAEQLAAANGLDADTLHVTLAMVGDWEGDLDLIADALRTVAGEHAPLQGTIGGTGQFGDGGPIILLPSTPGLVELRVAVTEALVDAGIGFSRDHGYVPHVTVGYPSEAPVTPQEGSVGAELHFDALLVVRGDTEIVEIPFTGAKPITAAAAEALGITDPFLEALIAAMCEPLLDADVACAHESFVIHGSQEELTRFREQMRETDPEDLLIAAAHPNWTAPAGDEIIDVPALVSTLRGRTDPVRAAAVETTMRESLNGVGIGFDVTNPHTAKVLAQAGSQVTEIAQTTQLNVMRIVKESYNEGLSIPETGKAIRAGMSEASVARSVLIARTELAGAVNGGSLAATKIFAEESQRAGEGGMDKQWLTSPGAVHPRHEDYEGLDGQTTNLDGFFDVGGVQLQYPGDPDGPPDEICNCFPGDTLVETPSLRAAMRRWYEGDLVRLRFASGDELAATPNHPVLRADGFWTPIGEIKEGDYLVSAVGIGSRPGAPDPDRPPAEIGETYRLASVAADPHRVASRPPDFHGDGTHGEVDVVTLDGSLLDDRDAATEEQIAQFGFALTTLARRRVSGETGAALMSRWNDRLHDLAAGIVGSGGERSSLPVAETAHPERVRVGTTTHGKAHLKETSRDHAAAHTYRFGDGEDGFPATMSFTNVVQVERESFQGFVYNLDTGVGWYTASSVLCRNCRCTMIYLESGAQVGSEVDAESGDTGAPEEADAGGGAGLSVIDEIAESGGGAVEDAGSLDAVAPDVDDIDGMIESLGTPSEGSAEFSMREALEMHQDAPDEVLARVIVDDQGQLRAAVSFEDFADRSEFLVHDIGSTIKGGGTKLMSDVANEAKLAGRRYVVVTSTPEALPFYERLGFRAERTSDVGTRMRLDGAAFDRLAARGEPRIDIGAAADGVSVPGKPPVPLAQLDEITNRRLNDWPIEPGPVAKTILGDAPDTEALYSDGKGNWSPQRLDLHRSIVQTFFRQYEYNKEGEAVRLIGDKIAPAADERVAYFTAGGGASGKSGLKWVDSKGKEWTLKTLRNRRDVITVDPDEIKKMLPEFRKIIDAGDPSAASVVHEESSMLAKQITEMAYARGFSVVLDSTGSGPTFATKKLAQAIGKGYDTQVSMISIPTNHAIERSVLRALNQESDSFGRFVAIKPLKDAHIGASEQLKIWKDLESLPKWRVFDNTNGTEVVAEGGGGKPIIIRDQKKWDDILAKADEPKQIDEHMRPIYDQYGKIDYYPPEEGGHRRGWGLGPDYNLPEEQLVGRPGGVQQVGR